MSLRKITTRIWPPVLDKFEEKMEARCLRRDAFLNKVLVSELNHLDNEVTLANSPAAQTFVAERLSQLDPKPVSLALDSQLMDKLDGICERKRIVRDAFFNRLFLLLAASPQLIDRLFFSAVADDWKRELWKEYESEWPKFFEDTFYPLEQGGDPFWAIRDALEMYSKDMGLRDYTVPETDIVIQVHDDTVTGGGVRPAISVYTEMFDNKQLKLGDLFGTNTYIADWQIPNHPRELAYRQKLDDLLLLKV